MDEGLQMIMQMLFRLESRAVDPQEGRAYDVTLTKQRLFEYAARTGADPEVYDIAFDAILYISQHLNPRCVKAVIRNSSRVEDLLAWHKWDAEKLRGLNEGFLKNNPEPTPGAFAVSQGSSPGVGRIENRKRWWQFWKRA